MKDMLNNTNEFTLKELYDAVDGFAPFKYSHMMIARGGYDNSGILIECHKDVKKVLFSLDLTEKVVNVAKRLKCDTIVTHHPVIYSPIKNLSIHNTGVNSTTLAVSNKINVISAHLNLDVTKNGIDHNLAKALGLVSNEKIFSPLEDGIGYGRQYLIAPVTFRDFIRGAKAKLNTKQVLYYGKLNDKVENVVSFCGGGAGIVNDMLEKNEKFSCDVVVTSDMAHRTIKYLVEAGKKILLISHYCAENYGFKIFSDEMKEKLAGKAEVYFYQDERFL